MKKLCLLLAAALVLWMMASAVADEFTYEAEGTFAAEDDGVDYSRYEDAYIRQLFSTSGSPTSKDGEALLDGVELAIFRELKAAAIEIAAGTRTDTKIEIGWDVFGETGTWYAEDLGLESLWLEDGSDADWDAIDAAVNEKRAIDMDLFDLMYMVKYDCPYEFYWSTGRVSCGSYGYRVWSDENG